MSSSIPNPLSGVTFRSGWETCMSKTYCKYPVIVAIVIGSLILLSTLYCVLQILCCGAKCCFCCASITKCLCCRCCRGGGGHSSRPNRDHYTSPLAHGNPYGTPKKSGYVDPAAYESGHSGGHVGGGSGFGDHGGSVGGPGYAGQGQYRSQPPPRYATTATFEEPSTRKANSNNKAQVNADALPAMPSWGNAVSRRVEESPERSPAGEDVELMERRGSLPTFETDDFKNGGQGHAGAAAAAAAAGTAIAGAGAGAAAAGARPGGYDHQGYGGSPGAGGQGYGHGAAPPAYAAGTAPHGYGQSASPQNYSQQQGYRNGPQDPYAQQQSPYGNTGGGGGGGGAYGQGSSPYGQQHHQNQSQTSYGVAQTQYGGYDNNSNASSTTAATTAYSNPQPAQQAQSPSQGGYTSYKPPPQQQAQQGSGPHAAAYPGQTSYTPSYAGSEVGRKPVQGSWQDL